MKKIITIISALIVGALLSVTAFAADLSVLPLAEEDGCVCQCLEKSVTIKRNLTIGENEILVIPSGKRLKLTNDKTLTVNGQLYIENGGSLIIESGTLSLAENSALFSNGRISVKKNGNVAVQSNASFVVSPTGSLSLKGTLEASIDTGCVACLGKYSGSAEGIKAEIISAASFGYDYYYNTCYNVTAYTEKEAKKLFPKITLDKSQDALIGGVHTYIRFFCDNGNTISLLFNGELENSTKMGAINGLRVCYE